MHPVILEEFNRICASKNIIGRVLEIGAVPKSRTLLAMDSLAGASEKIGVNLNPAAEFADFKILQENSNSMSFDDNCFDVILSNATLEHDKYFWKTLAEIRRVAKPGALIVIGIPGYRFYKLEKLKLRLRRLKWLKKLFMHPKLNMFFCSTITYEVHDYPGDFFRFSEQAVEEVILDGLEQKSFKSVMLPPRIIGCGVMPSET